MCFIAFVDLHRAHVNVVEVLYKINDDDDDDDDYVYTYLPSCLLTMATTTINTATTQLTDLPWPRPPPPHSARAPCSR